MLKIWDRDKIDSIQPFMDTIGDGIFIVDTEGIIAKSNKAACDMLGFNNKKEIEGQPALGLLGPTDETGAPINKRNAALFKSIRQGKKVNNAMRQFSKNDGSHLWATITTTPIIKKTGGVKGAVIVIRDITEEKQQQEYQTDFAHIASHDLRTPLGNLLWVVEYIKSEKPGKLNSQQREYVNDTYRTLKEMNRMVNDLLSVSRLQNKKIKRQTKKIALETIIKKVMADSEYYCQAQNVKIKMLVEGKRQHYLKADYNHIRTIVQNIIENAIRYSFANTEILVNVKKQNSHILFSCTNYGIGIPKDKQRFIFAKFFRAKNAVEKLGDGTGLGLYITYEMVKLNKGKIWFTSEPKKQTTFYVKFKTA